LHASVLMDLELMLAVSMFAVKQQPAACSCSCVLQAATARHAMWDPICAGQEEDHAESFVRVRHLVIVNL